MQERKTGQEVPIDHEKDSFHYRTQHGLSERGTLMSTRHNASPDEQQMKVIELLNRRLADAIDLQLQSKQTYWNVKGPNFLSLRELFDQITRGVEQDTDLIAERIVQLGGRAEGTVHLVSARSSLDGHQLATPGQSNALLLTLTDVRRHTQYASKQASELQDQDTADLFTEIARSTNKWLWLVKTSQHAGN